jgi:hypothetical protein
MHKFGLAVMAIGFAALAPQSASARCFKGLCQAASSRSKP